MLNHLVTAGPWVLGLPRRLAFAACRFLPSFHLQSLLCSAFVNLSFASTPDTDSGSVQDSPVWLAVVVGRAQASPPSRLFTRP